MVVVEALHSARFDHLCGTLRSLYDLHGAHTHTPFTRSAFPMIPRNRVTGGVLPAETVEEVRGQTHKRAHRRAPADILLRQCDCPPPIAMISHSNRDNTTQPATFTITTTALPFIHVPGATHTPGEICEPISRRGNRERTVCTQSVIRHHPGGREKSPVLCIAFACLCVCPAEIMTLFMYFRILLVYNPVLCRQTVHACLCYLILK